MADTIVAVTPDSKTTVQTQIKSARKQIQSALETGIRWLFFWESDDVKIGRLLRTFHHYFIISLIACYFLIHVLAPSYWYLLGIWCCFTLIWISHIINGGCVLTRIEQKLTGEKATIIDPLLELFQIPVSKETTLGITIMTSTVCFLFITSELVTRTLINLHEWMPYVSTLFTMWPFSVFQSNKSLMQTNLGQQMSQGGV
jgi:hypothetical protein